MKKILATLFLVGVLVLALAADALANSIYVGSLVGAEWKWDSTAYHGSDDLSGVIVNGDFSFGKFNLNLEYTNGTEKDAAAPYDYDITHFKIGYNLFSVNQSNLALTVGYYQLAFDNDDNYKIDGIMLGIDAARGFGKNSLLEGALSYSVSGTSKADGYPDYDATTLLFNAKYSYFFTAKLGVSVGYQLVKLEDDSDWKVQHSGPTAGITYRFK